MLFFSSLICFLFVITCQSDTDRCSPLLSSDDVTFLGEIAGKCLVVTKTKSNGGLLSSCDSINSEYTQVSIDSEPENIEISVALRFKNIDSSYIGYVFRDGKWAWINNDTSSYQNFKFTPSPPPVPRSTVPPNQQRRSTAVVIAIDASLYSTMSLIEAQIDFVKSLVGFISDHGPSEFAIFAFGCSQINPWTNQYPYFVSNYDEAFKMIENVENYLSNFCVRSNPLDFQTMFSSQHSIYYNRQVYSPRPFVSKYISMIFFSSSTNSSSIQSISPMTPILNSNIITINIGSKSSSIQQLSIPSKTNGLRANTPDDILNLVSKVDQLIFGTTSSEIAKSDSVNDASQRFDASENVSMCAYLNSTDNFWYSDEKCSDVQRNVLCQFAIPEIMPNISDPCFSSSTNFTYFPNLKNNKCYQVSFDKKQFASSENDCLSDNPIYEISPVMTSIQSSAESDALTSLLSNVANEGMFWIGLRRSPTDPNNWFFINGDTFNSSTFNNWRNGYPRKADGYDCVAYVIIDQKWINTDCNQKLFSICAYRYL